jgi:hypothetical protein
MNKRFFLLIILLMFTVLIVSAKIYFNLKNKLLNENNNYLMLEEKVKEVYNLKQKYKLNKSKLNYLKKYCSVLEKSDKYIIECKNLNKSKLNLLQNILFKSNFKIKSFDIDKDKNASIKVEIIK